MDTPELKAKLIVLDYYVLILSQFKTKNICEIFAKELSHRCVYEVKKSLPPFVGGRAYFINPDIDYWEKVDNLIDKVKII